MIEALDAIMFLSGGVLPATIVLSQWYTVIGILIASELEVELSVIILNIPVEHFPSGTTYNKSGEGVAGWTVNVPSVLYVEGVEAVSEAFTVANVGISFVLTTQEENRTPYLILAITGLFVPVKINDTSEALFNTIPIFSLSPIRTGIDREELGITK